MQSCIVTACIFQKYLIVLVYNTIHKSKKWLKENK
jgi:hypothetical protein